ncbi:MetQ/NlpA family ABC transporter substrate-binding protein [Ignatzschineria sp. F8392]|uniref:MetQ/NlpA family ABC transporter substrate-binding protein n=1 Tax=Ignatzschineria sp. F8392 TaxID=1980117 RepID=UPI001E5B7506|nr:MetQ/NlpA family ABC transporter substrate-binding protein [Ignatzschineria sp. F8392]
MRKRLSKRGVQFYKNISRWALVIVIGFLVMACGKSDEKTIVLGFGPSTYAEQFEYGIKPILEKEGYDVRVKIFSQNMQINPALIGGDIDVAGHQSEAYMKKMNQELKGNMVKLADTASAPQSLRSNKYQSLDEVRAGMRVAIPNDPVNGERAARILESIGWVEVTNDDVSRFSVNDIKSLNGIEVIALDPAQGLRVLDEVDYAVINGNYVASAGLKISDGLVVEKTPAEHVVIIVIREDDVEKPWAQALKSAYEASEFESYIKSEPLFDGFILPKAWER